MNKPISPEESSELDTKISFFSQWVALGALILFLVIGFVVVTSQRQEQILSIPASGRMLTSSGKRAYYPSKTLEVTSAQQVWDYFEDAGYTIKNIQEGHIDVPRLYLTQIVHTWSKNHTTQFKKDLFFRAMLPIILRSNELIMEDREELLILFNKYKTSGGLSLQDTAWLTSLAKTYRLLKNKGTKAFTPALFPALIERVDEIPVSMAVAQTAYESAYATSRFAGEGNSLFGQWRWGSGLVPKGQRKNLGDYRIADFDTPLHSAIAFSKNLNTNQAYREFRQKRAEMRKNNKPLSGLTLATTLHRYSEKGEAYIHTLQRIITHNNLMVMDKIKLGSGEPLSLVPNWPNQNPEEG